MRSFLGLFTLVLLIAATSAYLTTHSSGPRFATAAELHHLLQTQGLSLHDDGAPGHPSASFYVVADSADAEQIAEIFTRQECGLTPRWKGIVWVAQIHTAGRDLCVGSVGGHVRTWGNVLIAGDAELIERVELAIRDRREEVVR